MAEKIDIIITGDQNLQKNVEQAKAIEQAIEKSYKTWQKMGGGDNDKVIAQMEKLTSQSKKYNVEIKEQSKNQKALDKIQKEYNATLIASNNLQKSEVSELTKLNSKVEVLKKNQKLLKLENKGTSESYIQNKIRIKELSAEYRKLESEQIKERNSLKIINQLQKKENLTLKEQKQLFSALNVQYNKLVTEEGRASKSTLNLQKKMEKLNKSILKSEKAVKLHQRNVGNYPKAFSGFGAMFAGIAGAVTGAIMAVRSIISATKKYIDLANAQKDAELKLNVVMKQRMNATDSEVKSILDLTSAQQKLGVVGDEVQIAGAQQLSTFLKQSDSLDVLIPAMNNLIVQQKGMNGTQQDAVSIANLFGKVMDGQTSALTRVGITLTDAQQEMIKFGDETQRANVLSQVITDNVGNMNEEFAKTDAGKMQQAKNELGDLGEELGGVLLPMMANFFKKMLQIATKIKDFALQMGILKDETHNLGVAQKRYNDFTDKFNKKISDEKTKIAELVLVAKNDKRSKNERITAIKTLNSISPEYLGNITLENIDTQKTIKTINKYIDALGRKVKAQLAQEKMSDIYSQIYDAEVLMTEAQIKQADLLTEAPGLADLATMSYADLSAELQGLTQAQTDATSSVDYSQYTQDFADSTQATNEQKQALLDLMGQQVEYGASITGLHAELSGYQDIFNAMGISLGDLTITTNDLTDANNNLGQSTANIDIYAQKVAELNAKNTAKELELRQKYKDDSEQIELELLEFKKNSQLELLNFIDDNNLSEHQTADNLKYLDLTKQLSGKELQLQQQKYDDLYSDYQNYLQKKQLEDEAYILQLKKGGADEVMISQNTLLLKQKQLQDYLDFLNDNANAQNEIERLSLQNQLVDLQLQLDKFDVETSDESVIQKKFGLSQEDFDELKGLVSDFAGYYADFISSKLNADIEYSQKRRDLLQQDIDADQERIDNLQKNLDVENIMRDDNLKNNALLTESLIRQSQMRIEAKKEEQRKLLADEQEKAKKLKDIQKTQIYAQFAVDSASAISSLIKFAYANPWNAINPATAIIQIATGMTTIVAGFLKARSSVKSLAEGEVAITDGKGNVDDVPALLMKGESVITKKGTQRAENFLTGLNKNATADQLMQLLAIDFGQKSLKENNIFVNIDSFELREQNKNLKQSIIEIQQNNLYLSKLLSVTENKADYIPLPNGYKRVTNNSETTYIYE